jgi:hypothetical protein
MERKQRTSSLSDAERRLKMKINEHKMLINSLHDLFNREDSSSRSIENLKSMIDSTINEIEAIRKEIEGDYAPTINIYNDEKKNEILRNSGINIFDNIKKKQEYKKPERYFGNGGICPDHSFFEDIRKKDKEVEEKKNSGTMYDLGNSLNVDNIVLCNRFLLDMSVIGIPETMVKKVLNERVNGNRCLYVDIYDFVTDSGVPVMQNLSMTSENRKFTLEIKHLDASGKIMYKEKFNGCRLDTDEIYTTALRYDESEPAVITLRILYDGVSYEAGR